MSEQKIYIGSLGPHLYDDTDLINDSDGEFAGGTYEGVVTSGQLRVETEPTESYHVMRLTDSNDDMFESYMHDILGD